MLIGHNSELFLGGLGSISGSLRFGVTYEDAIWLLGMEGGLKARLTF